METPRLLPSFQLAAASVCGRDHQRASRNNQDALAVERGARHLVLVVSDGCGSSPGSEAGARLGARLLAAALLRRLESTPAEPALTQPSAPPADPEAALEQAQADVVAQLSALARGLCATPAPTDRALAAAIKELLLFTLVGAIVGPEETVLFALGDGLLALDGVLLPLGPFPGNQPPYLGYALLPPELHGFSAEELRLRIRAQTKTAALRSLALGTDGALDLDSTAAPGALLLEPVLFNNPDGLRRRLFLLAKDQPGRPAPLHDDTTLVLLRRAPAAEADVFQEATTLCAAPAAAC